MGFTFFPKMVVVKTRPGKQPMSRQLNNICTCKAEHGKDRGSRHFNNRTYTPRKHPSAQKTHLLQIRGITFGPALDGSRSNERESWMNITLTDLCKLIGLQLGIKKVEPDQHLAEDLGAESIDLQNIIMAVEDKYDIEIEDGDIAEIRTTNDLYQLIVDQHGK